MKKYGEMDNKQPFEIKRESFGINLSFANSLICGLNGGFFLFLLPSKRAEGVIWLGAAFLWFIGYLWAKNTPYIRITSLEIMIFSSPIYAPVFIPWESIQEIRFLKKHKVLLRVSGQKK